MKKIQAILLIVLGSLGAGCAITSGLQTHDLPNQGQYQTQLGTTVELIKLTQAQLPLLGTAEPQVNSQQLFSSQVPVYALRSGDLLSVQLWAYPEITPHVQSLNTVQSIQANGYRIDQQGYIQFPLVGRVPAAGRSLQQFQLDLEKRLSRYLTKPDAIVRILSFESQPYTILGNVVKNGQYFLNDQPTSLYTALGMAGGTDVIADNTAIQLIRNGITYDLNLLELEKQGNSLHRLYIHPQDTIYVSTRDNQKVYVMGEAGKNQAIVMRDQGMSLSDVLGESLGLNPLSASAKRIYILRSEPQTQQTRVYHMDLSNFGDFGLANQFKVRSNDIVYVDATGLARWQRIVNQIIPFSNALYNLDRLGNN